VSMPDALSSENVLAIVGDEDIVMGFKALGFKTYALRESDNFEIIFDELARNKTAVCLIQDKLYRSSKDIIDRYKNLPLPIIIPFATSGATDDLDNLVKDIRLRATGVLQL